MAVNVCTALCRSLAAAADLHLGERAELGGYGAALKACSGARQWQHAALVLASMASTRVAPDAQAQLDLSLALQSTHRATEPNRSRRSVGQQMEPGDDHLMDAEEMRVLLSAGLLCWAKALKLGVTDLAGVLKVLKEPARLVEGASGRILQPTLDSETSIEAFVISVEEYRRDRLRRIEAGDESAALVVPRAKVPAKAGAKAPARVVAKAPAKAIAKTPAAKLLPSEPQVRPVVKMPAKRPTSAPLPPAKRQRPIGSP
ncbi:unnamed protein product, partial [Effrenium voratum]